MGLEQEFDGVVPVQGWFVECSHTNVKRRIRHGKPGKFSRDGCAQFECRPLTHRGQGRAEVLDFKGIRARKNGEFVNALGVSVECEQPRAPRVGEREHFVERGAEAAHEVRELGAAVLHCIEAAFSVDFDVGKSAREVSRNLSELGAELNQRLTNLGQHRINRRDPLDLSTCILDRADGVGRIVIARNCGVRGGNRDAKVFDVRHALSELLQFDVFADLRRNRFDVGEGCTQIIRFALAPVAFRGQFGKLGCVLLPAAKRLLVFGEGSRQRGAGVTVERFALLGCRTQSNLVALSVHSDECVGQRLQNASGCRSPPDDRTR
ncbi:unannotated protein [freshwater metagenome]|uniref:Unannotated protein n=1 Tax=freshwater metagenome TaxID=449393 RepID=A0A6J6EAJ1_9ZZZZ